LEQLMIGGGRQTPFDLAKELLQTSLPQIEKDLREEQEEMQVRPAPPDSLNRFSTDAIALTVLMRTSSANLQS
jgi:hypothetical protein